MPNVKISELPAITTPTTSDLVPVVQSGSTDKITRGNFLKNVDADMTSSDVTTNNVTSSKHGFAPKSPADATQFLNGAATPAFAAVKDSDLSTSDITTNDASTTKHGFVLKATAPSAGLRNVVAIDNGETVYKNAALFDATNPADLGSASPGSAMTAARRDHVHNTPAGGGTGNVYFPLEKAKGSADTPDDEFNSGTLDAKWTVVDGGSGTVDMLAS